MLTTVKEIINFKHQVDITLDEFEKLSNIRNLPTFREIKLLPIEKLIFLNRIDRKKNQTK
jgi:hypothetical protein